jgi:hypothetical protein
MIRKDLFAPTSRYASTETAIFVTSRGVEVAYLRRRFVPPMERFDVLGGHVVVAGERLDHLAAQVLGDPEQFWRLCDANGAMLPDALMEVGRTLRITMPEGIPGPTRE